MKNRDLIAWLQQRDPDEEISLAGSELAKLVYSDLEETTSAENRGSTDVH